LLFCSNAFLAVDEYVDRDIVSPERISVIPVVASARGNGCGTLGLSQ